MLKRQQKTANNHLKLSILGLVKLSLAREARKVEICPGKQILSQIYTLV